MPVDGDGLRSTPSVSGESPAAARPPASPLDESQFALVQEAARTYTPIKKATRTALSSSIVTLLIGASAVPFLLIWPSFSGLLITVGLGVIGAVEFLGYRKLRKADPAAARFLATNQLAFLGLIVFYCLLQMLSFSPEDAKAAALSPEIRAQLGAVPDVVRAIDRDIERWAPQVTYGFYSLVMVLSLFFQGGMAYYYFTRRKFLEAFQHQTPPWVRRLLVECAPQSLR